VSRIEDAARNFIAKRRAALDLKAKRNATKCVDYEPPDPEVGGGTAMCWQILAANCDVIPEAEWCANCRERARLHNEYHRAARLVPGAARRLEQACIARPAAAAALAELGPEFGGRGRKAKLRWSDGEAMWKWWMSEKHNGTQDPDQGVLFE
jgi:hypothetical protein